MKIIKTELIDEFLKANNISKTKFCKISRISYSVLKKIYNNQTNFGILYLFRIAKILKIEVCEIFI